MIIVSGERNILLKLFSRQLTPAAHGRVIDSIKEIPQEEVVAIYHDVDNSQSFPDVLIIETPNIQEFFAWSSTYLPQWSPLSSNIRILSRDQIDRLERTRQTAIPQRLLRGLFCLTVGELFYEWRMAKGQASPSLLSLRSTFGYAATNALLLGEHCLSNLLARWSRTQHLLQLNPRRMNSTTLKNIWSPFFLMAESVSFEKAISVEAIAAAISEGTQGKLFDDRAFGDVLNPRGRREDFVVELEGFIRTTRFDNAVDCFWAATVASKMSSAPLTHFDVLGDMTNSEPRILLWYAFLSGMLANEPASKVIERLLFQLEGDLRSQLWLKPDITLDELEVIMKPDSQIPEWVGIGARFVNVEIEPGICSSFRLRAPATETSGLQLATLDDKRLFEQLLTQLREVFERKSATPKTSSTNYINPRTPKTSRKKKN
ncbi:MAG: hypothetical protein R3C20_23630 [Planctomycetaceae bacterium]